MSRMYASKLTSTSLARLSFFAITAIACILAFATPASALTPGSKKVAVIFVNFADRTGHTQTEADMRSRVFTAPNSVNEYTKEVSYQTVSLRGHERADGDVFGPYPIAWRLSDGCDYDDYMTFASQARAAMTSAGHPASNYDYFVYVLPATDGCIAPGWTDVAPSQHIFMDTSLGNVDLTHEFGHAYGLQHAQKLRCLLGSIPVTFPTNGSCDIQPYGDSMDVMGSGSNNGVANLFSGVHRARIGLLPTSAILRATAFGNYTVSDLNTAPSGINKQLLILPGAGTTLRYIDYRRPRPIFDNFTAPHEGSNGVGVRFGLDYATPDGHTFNMYLPAPSSFKSVLGPDQFDRGILEVGKTMFDPTTNTTLATTAISASSATVSYTSGSPSPASQVRIESGVLKFTAGAGQANDLSVTELNGNVEVVDNGGPLSAGAGCSQTTLSRVACPIASVNSYDVALGDKADAIYSTLTLASTINGGDEDDVIITSSGADRIAGGAGNDYFAPGSGADTLDNSDRSTAITANLGVTSGVIQTIGSEVDTIAAFGSDGFNHYIGGSVGDVVTTGYDPGTFETGAGDDTVVMATRNHVVDGGQGLDTADFTPRISSAVTVSLDGNLGDGARTGEASNIKPTIEHVIATSAADKLVGSPGPDTLEGGDWHDEIIGEGGADTLLGGPGNDSIDARDGVTDAIDCGAGTADSANVDSGEAAPGCETVTSAAGSSVSVNNGELIFGGISNANDQLVITIDGSGYRVTDNGGNGLQADAGCTTITASSVTCAGPITSGTFDLVDGTNSLVHQTNLSTTVFGGTGADTITTGFASDTIYGGDGADVINPRGGDDWVDAGPANDNVQVRDGNGSDNADCGDGTADVAAGELIDSLGNCETATFAPPVTINSGPANGSSIANPTPTFTFSSTEPGANFICSVDGSAYSSCTSPRVLAPLADGSHSFAVKATDVFGAESDPVSRTFTVDTVQPTVNITSPAAGAVLGTNSASVAFTTSADAVSRTCQLDGGAVDTACVSPKLYSALADGSHTVAVAASDAAGNSATATRTFTVDTTAPTLSITAPTPGQVLTSSTVAATFTAGADATQRTCQLDSGTIDNACVSPKTYTSVTNGSHTITVTARDAVGNVRTQAVTFTVSTTPPVLTMSAASASGTTSLSSVGSTDWIHWGRDNASSLNRKAGSPSPSITGFNPIGSAGIGRTGSGAPGFTWTSGNPVPTQSTATQGRVTTSGVNNGFQITVPATNTATRTIRIYAGVYRSRGRLRATLSDGSVAAINDTSTNSSLSTLDRVFTINFRSIQPNATLTIEWTMSASNLSGSNVRLAAAAL